MSKYLIQYNKHNATGQKFRQRRGMQTGTKPTSRRERIKSFSIVDAILPTYTVVCDLSVGVILGLATGLIRGGLMGPRIPVTGGRNCGGMMGPGGRGGNAGRTIGRNGDG